MIGSDETPEPCRVEASVGVGDRFEREVVHPRQALRRAVRQARQFAAVALRQMPPRRTNLFLNEIEVVEQPVAGRGNAPAFLDGFRQQTMRRDQGPLVFGEA